MQLPYRSFIFPFVCACFMCIYVYIPYIYIFFIDRYIFYIYNKIYVLLCIHDICIDCIDSLSMV